MHHTIYDSQYREFESWYYELVSCYSRLLHMYLPQDVKGTEEWTQRERHNAAKKIVAALFYPDSDPLPEHWQHLFVWALLKAAEQARTTQYEMYGLGDIKSIVKHRARAKRKGEESSPIPIRRVKRLEGFIPAKNLPLCVPLDEIPPDKEAFLIKFAGTAIFWVQQRTLEVLKKMLGGLSPQIFHPWETAIVTAIGEDVQFIRTKGGKRHGSGRKKGENRLGANPEQRKQILLRAAVAVNRKKHFGKAGWDYTFRCFHRALNEEPHIEISESALRSLIKKDAITLEDLWKEINVKPH